jgi:hypothetical protein
MAVCCQNLPLGAHSSRSAPSVLVGALFKKLGLFLNTGLCQCPIILQRLWCLSSLHLPSTGTDEATYMTVETMFSLYVRFIFLWSKKKKESNTQAL